MNAVEILRPLACEVSLKEGLRFEKKMFYGTFATVNLYPFAFEYLINLAIFRMTGVKE